MIPAFRGFGGVGCFGVFAVLWIDDDFGWLVDLVAGFWIVWVVGLVCLPACDYCGWCGIGFLRGFGVYVYTTLWVFGIADLLCELSGFGVIWF